VARERDSIPEPRDLAEAREIIATLHRGQRDLAQQLVYAERKTLLLQHELDVLLRRIFGRRSEKLTADERQLLLAILEGQGIPGQGAVEAVRSCPRSCRGGSRWWTCPRGSGRALGAGGRRWRSDRKSRRSSSSGRRRSSRVTECS
jgi:hypothetical protein